MRLKAPKDPQDVTTTEQAETNGESQEAEVTDDGGESKQYYLSVLI